MTTEQLAYWYTFSIPAIFILLRIVLQRVIDGPPWQRKHLYIGLDLSIYAFAAAVVNVFEQLKLEAHGFEKRTFHTVGGIVVIVLVLVFQITVHQVWESSKANGTGKTWMLCVVSNLIGAGMIAAFVWGKIRMFV